MQLTAEPAGLRLFLDFARRSLPLEAGRYDAPPTGRVPASQIVEMMDRGAQATGDGEFGIRYARALDLRGLGAICLLWESSADIAAAMQANARYLQAVNSAALMRIEEQAGEVAMIFSFLPVSQASMRHFVEAVMVCALRMVRQGLGEQWSPLRIEFAHSTPAQTALARRVFRAPIDYGSGRNALLIDRNDLRRPFSGANREIFELMQLHLDRLLAGLERGLVARAEQLAFQYLPQGPVNLAALAGLLGMAPRSLQRELSRQGTSFSEILANARRLRARQYFCDEPMPRLGRLAELLGFSDPSVASRFLKEKCGVGILSLRGGQGIDDILA